MSIYFSQQVMRAVFLIILLAGSLSDPVVNSCRAQTFASLSWAPGVCTEKKLLKVLLGYLERLDNK